MSQIFLITVFLPLLPIAASFLFWKKYKNKVTLIMLLGFVVSWVFSNLIYLGAKYIWPNQIPPNFPEGNTMDKIEIISNISILGYVVAYICLVVFAVTLYRDKNEGN